MLDSLDLVPFPDVLKDVAELERRTEGTLEQTMEQKESMSTQMTGMLQDKFAMLSEKGEERGRHQPPLRSNLPAPARHVVCGVLLLSAPSRPHHVSPSSPNPKETLYAYTSHNTYSYTYTLHHHTTPHHTTPHHRFTQ